MIKKHIAIEEHDSGGMFCLGIYDDHKTAVGAIMESLWDFKAGYKSEGSIFEHTELNMMEGSCGEVMTVKYKAPSWKKLNEQYYYVLFVFDSDEEG